MFRNVIERWSSRWSDACAAALAASLSWWIAHDLLGHAQPIFAAVSSIVCLAPGLPSRARQAVNMTVGVVTGVLVGELLLILPLSSVPLQIGILTFCAIMAALTLGLAPVLPIQAAVSAILVMAIGPMTAGPVRMADVAVGAGLGLLFSQVLFTPNPVRLISEAASRMFEDLECGFRMQAQAVAKRSPRGAEEALDQIMTAHSRLNELEIAVTSAKGISRWSLRGRLHASKTRDMATHYDRHALRFYAAAVLFGQALADRLHCGEEPPRWLQGRIDRLAEFCGSLAAGSATTMPGGSNPAPEEAAPPGWRSCLDHLHTMELELARLTGLKP